MRTATITIDSVQTNMPEQEVRSPFQGFRLTITAPSGNSASLPVDPKLIWVLGNMVEGATYQLLIECVDGNGIVIDSLPSQSILVPGGEIPVLTYPKPLGISIEWS